MQIKVGEKGTRMLNSIKNMSWPTVENYHYSIFSLSCQKVIVWHRDLNGANGTIHLADMLRVL